MKQAFVVVAVCMVLFTACQPTVPKEYIQPDDMEDILYDYFVSQGIAQNEMQKGGNEDYLRHLYFTAVLKKHAVSRAEFDSSLVYYYTRADRFLKICKNVQERLGQDAMNLGASASEVERFTVTALTGDTANIWNGERSRLLMPYAPDNHIQFSVLADTAFRKGDSFMLSFYSDFLYQSGSKDAVAYLAVKYTNDSIVTANNHFSINGRTDLRLSGCDKDVKEVSGFIYLGQGYEKTPNLRLLILSGIQLIRFHKVKGAGKPDQKPAGMSRADSLRMLPDSLRPKHHRLGDRPQSSSGGAEQPEPIKPITR